MGWRRCRWGGIVCAAMRTTLYALPEQTLNDKCCSNHRLFRQMRWLGVGTDRSCQRRHNGGKPNGKINFYLFKYRSGTGNDALERPNECSKLQKTTHALIITIIVCRSEHSLVIFIEFFQQKIVKQFLYFSSGNVSKMDAGISVDRNNRLGSLCLHLRYCGTAQRLVDHRLNAEECAIWTLQCIFRNFAFSSNS